MSRIPKDGLGKIIWRPTLFAALVSTLVLGLSTPASAASGKLYTTPGSTIITPGSTITIDVRLGGVTADAVEATVAYNPSFFKYVSTDDTDSAFPVAMPVQTTSTSVTVARAILAPDTVQSDALVTRITFKALNRTAITTLKVSGNAAFQGEALNPLLRSTTVRIQN